MNTCKECGNDVCICHVSTNKDLQERFKKAMQEDFGVFLIKEDKRKNLRKVQYQTYSSKEGISDVKTGYFHKWGSEAIETMETIVSVTIAIIESELGYIETTDPKYVKFDVSD